MSRNARWGWMLGVAGAVGCGADASTAGQEPTSQTSARALLGDTSASHGALNTLGTPLAVCPGVGTRHVWFTGNAQVVPTQSWPAWDPAQPRWTSSWHTPTELFTADGYAVSVVFYFLPEGEGLTYHALLADSELELASGTLAFDAAGALESVRETRPLRLWGPGGFAAPIELSFGTPIATGGTGLDGVTGQDTWTSIQYARDGWPPQLGVECGEPPESPAEVLPLPGPPVPAPVVCAPRGSTSISLRGNLDPAIPVSSASWDLTQPDATSTLSAVLSALDPDGRLVNFVLYLLKRGAWSWEYHVTFLGDRPGPELGAGRLSFNPNGTLERVDVWRALRLPGQGGTLGKRLKLNLGRATSRGGTGADGLTSFPAATDLVFVEHDGSAGTISARCLEAGPPSLRGPESMFWGSGAFLDESYPLCAGAVSTLVSSYMTLSRFMPIATEAWEPSAAQSPSDYWVSTTVHDTTLEPVPLELRLRRVAEDSWEGHVLLERAGELVERASFRLDVDADGRLAHIEGDRSVSLRLPDGSEGPPLALDFGVPLDERGPHLGYRLVAYQYGDGGIWADGWAPDVCDEL